MTTSGIEVLVLGFIVGLLLVHFLRRGYPKPVRTFRPLLPIAGAPAVPVAPPARRGGPLATCFRRLEAPLHPVLVERCRICGGNLAEGEHRHARRPNRLPS